MGTGLPVWTDGKNYRITAKVTDKAVNAHQRGGGFRVTGARRGAPGKFVAVIDRSGRERPGQSSLNSVSGTAWDIAGPGGSAGKLDKVLVHIKRPAQDVESLTWYWKWTTGNWDASGLDEDSAIYWGTSTIHVPGVAISSWTHSVLPPPGVLTQGYTYIVRARARDASLPQGNTQQIFALNESSFTIVWDAEPPSASVTGYEDGDGNGRVNPAGAWTISGGITDSPAAVLSNVRLRSAGWKGRPPTTDYRPTWSTTLPSSSPPLSPRLTGAIPWRRRTRFPTRSTCSRCAA